MKSKILILFILLSCLFVSTNFFCYSKENKYFVKKSYQITKKTIIVKRPKANNIIHEQAIDEITVNSGIVIFPNPADDLLNINVNESLGNNITVKLFDLLSREIKSKKVDKGKATLELKGIVSGIYYMLIFCEDNVQYSSTIIKK